ncbi:MAG: tetratricopeptide repeat protein [Desulfomicrobium sp.]|nr:tetratricopeptide repeat protein [Desulfomicrobium sp.]
MKNLNHNFVDSAKKVEDLLKEKKYTEIIEIISTIQDPTTKQLEQRALAYYEIGNYKDAVKDFQKVLSSEPLKTKFSTFQKARTSVNCLKTKGDELTNIWRGFSDDISLKMGKVARDLSKGDNKDALSYYEDIIPKIFIDKKIQEIWIENFKKLSTLKNAGEGINLRQKPLKQTVFVSGHGWSGSGAIYDWLKEFKAIDPIKGEFSVLEADSGFKSVVQSKNDIEKSITKCINFFFLNMLGYFPLECSSSYKEILTARKFTLSEKYSMTYALACKKVTEAMICFVRSIEKNVDNGLKYLCSEIIDNLMLFYSKDNLIPLIDNSIHIQNIYLFQYVENSTIVCSFRDPRSNFIALKNEFAGFKQSVENYVSLYRKRYENFEANIKKLNTQNKIPNSSKIIVTQFEEFVSSESYRENLALELGLDLRLREKFKYFKPWESFRNTQLHLDYENQDEIRYIEEHLPEYCYDFDIKPAFPKSQE